MFEAQLGKASVLKKIVDAVRELIKNASFDCNESYIKLETRDASCDAFIALKLPKEIFDTYRCDRSVSLGLNLANVAKALKCANNDDVCVLRFADHGNVVFAFHDAGMIKNQEITIKLMDIHNKHLDIPDQKYAATLEMSSAEFAKTCLDISQFSDSVLITATKFGVVFSGKGETGSNVVTFNGEKEEDAEGSNVITFEVNESVNSTFSIKYMLQFAKAAGISDRVRLSLSNGAPVVVEFKIDVNGYLRYYLRPFVPILNDRLEEFRLRALKEGSTEDDPEEDMINNWLASWLPPAANLSPLDTTLHSVRKVEKEIIRMKLTMGEIWTIHNELLSSLSVSINPDIVESWGIAIANFRSSSTVVEEHVNGLTEGGDGLSESLALHRMRNNQVTFVNNIVRSALFRFL